MITFSLHEYNKQLLIISRDGKEVGEVYFYESGDIASVYEDVPGDFPKQIVVFDMNRASSRMLEILRKCTEHFSIKSGGDDE